MSSKFHYTSERNVQIVISLLKQHGIHRVIASPGTTNMTFVESLQNDPYFQIWSSVDERSAAYLACGIASSTGEPIVLSCTGATASRNYMPGLTEAFYRKLPVLAVTSHRGNHKVGHLIDQQIDRRELPADIVMDSVTVPMVKDAEDERYCEIEANKAILALTFNGGGPAHINLYTKYSSDFSIEKLPQAHAIYRHVLSEKLPEIPQNGRIAISIGAHQPFSEQETEAIDRFCATYDAVVFCDHTSNYHGKYETHFQLISGQKQWDSPLRHVNLLVHIGEVSGDGFHVMSSHTWRVSPDGALRDTFGNLRRVFMMKEMDFFLYYGKDGSNHIEYLTAVQDELDMAYTKFPELPFGNIWIAQHMFGKLPEKCIFHMGIYNSLRSWNFFPISSTVQTRCNVGGFGIDGGVSTFIGSSLIDTEKMHIGVFGDLAFFYDMNVVGNRHVGNNVRIMLINNGRGTEFRNYNHPCYFLGEDADQFLAAAGHYGNKSFDLVKHYASDLGYEYMSAVDKASFLKSVDRFLTPEVTDKPMLFEVFTETPEESKALEMTLNYLVNSKVVLKNKIKKTVKSTIQTVLGEGTLNNIKKIVK